MTFMIRGGSADLEALHREPKDMPVRAAAVLCHPHPLYGGTMDNRVVYRAGKGALEAGLATLRFNFRGVGASTGFYDDGIGEQDDVISAIDWLERQYPKLPLALVGFSFGAWVGLQVATRDPRIKAAVGLGLPLGSLNFDFLAEYLKPSLYIVGTRDEHCPKEKIDSFARRLPSSSTVSLIEGADHFFSDRLEQMQTMITDFFKRLDLQGNIA